MPHESKHQIMQGTGCLSSETAVERSARLSHIGLLAYWSVCEMGCVYNGLSV